MNQAASGDASQQHGGGRQRPPSRETQTLSGAGPLVRYANFVKLPHTLFALPFALVGVTLASYRAPITWGRLAWTVLAFTSARFAAMGFNRIADRHFDACNPRTAMRELPSGEMSVREAWIAVIVAVVLFALAASRLNALCFALAPAAIAWVFFYSYTKRFTRWSHLVLGLGLGIAPVGGYLALTGQWSDPAWMLPALAAAVMCWTAGFDILYALQDIDFDRAHSLHSIPAQFGVSRALILARTSHVLTVAFLAAVGIATGGGRLYVAGVVAAAALLTYEHTLMNARDVSRVDKAFFTVNMALSSVFFAFVLAERLSQ
ncbi:MAG TPA: 4-hydroxybenzoate octaprenyltransferase [Gemmatimonadaceae bacterium]|nr:4-hydroxybenzoate octaprenyltransferase [Gemmatimonadaceae bacterium]